MTLADMLSVLSIVVAAIAAFYAYRAPTTAVEEAERLRGKSQQREREQALFNILMAERGRWGSPAMLSALNSAKIIFRDNPSIIDAWFKLHSAAGKRDWGPLYFDLLEAISRQVGQRLRREDIEQFFVSTSEDKHQAIRMQQIDAAYSQMLANQPSGSRPSTE